jgi:hypothetical protein
MKTLLSGMLFVIILSCNNNDVDNKTLKSSDSNSRKSIDSSKIINQASKLPGDTSGTTVNH